MLQRGAAWALARAQASGTSGECPAPESLVRSPGLHRRHAAVSLRRHHCSRYCSPLSLQSLLPAVVTAVACRCSLLPLAAVAVTAAPLAFGQVSLSHRFYY
ncbi:hypothetical protein BHM03_00035655 [Ensete ventricosum]|nr:hypothetical protein BHM03_00035655 [Ensete ventricosum]